MGRVGFRGDPEAGTYEDAEDGGSGAEDAAFLELEGLSLSEVLLKGHETLLRRMVAKAMAGTIGHQEASVLRNLLRDNGMTMGAPPPPKTIEHDKPRALPKFDPPDYEA